MTSELRVLVADDDQAIVWLWMRVLQWGCGAEVTAVFDGQSAIARLAEQQFDLVITDLRMPGASGLDVLSAASQREPRVPALLMTRLVTDEIRTSAARLGADRILEKPFHIEEAVAALGESIGRRVPAR